MSELDRSSNRGRTLAFRDEVVIYLQHQGFEHVTRRRDLSHLKLSAQLGEDTGDILGLPWALSVRRMRTIDLPDSLGAAQFKAGMAGTKLYAAVHHRRDTGVANSYVTMPLNVFVEVLRTTPQPQSEAPAQQ